MKEKTKSFSTRHPNIFLYGMVATLIVIFAIALRLVKIYKIDTYVYIGLFLTSLFLLFLTGRRTYIKLVIPFLLPLFDKRPKLFSGIFIIMPLWGLSFYLVFSLEIPTILDGKDLLLLLIQALGCVLFVVSIILSWKWMNMKFATTSIYTAISKEQIDKNLKRDLESIKNGNKDFRIFLRSPNLWDKIQFGKESFELFYDGMPKSKEEDLPKFEENNMCIGLKPNIIIASLFDTLLRKKLFKHEYTIEQQKEISKVCFNVGSSMSHAENRYSSLFDWI